ncbi:MAG: phospho-N-acetylmuramoyl-pentapeptide-transferase [Deltaproteobacteria bacterium]|jgi:phospho-N-acetylmuramoyl-pentapeptide-transferase|nr:phospho-N-acetylmuramoyl-pentapeptide-transferase [Deltaproteobacteria bacterium]
MLYHLLSSLQEYINAFNVLRYITFRTFVAFIIAFIIAIWAQPKFIRWVKSKHMTQPIRDCGPQTHLAKQGTPTMGGVIFVAVSIIGLLLFADLQNPYIWIMTGLTFSYATIGFIDDYLKVVKKNTDGINAKTKLFWQFLLATIFIVALLAIGFPTTIVIPFFKTATLTLPWWLFIPFTVLVIVGCSNAVNLTDGLDGLVVGPIITVALTYGIFAYVTGNAKTAEYLQIPYIYGIGELAIFAGAIIAGGLGFLWFNSYPAQVFMGDVGSLALGGALGMLAVITQQEILLIVAGGVFVVEALSVMLQLFFLKKTGRRVFKMAPLHHHFELSGIAETKIIVRTWIISFLLALLALSTLKLR